jgi:hypothetical protein
VLSSRIIIPVAMLLAACGEPAQDFEVAIEVNEQVTTVLDITWTTTEPGISWVEFGREGEYDMVTPIAAEAGTEHSFQLVGVGAGNELSFRAITETADGQLISEGTATTGDLPEGIASFRVESYDEEIASSDRWLLTGYENEEGSWLVAVDRRGGVVWYEHVAEDAMPFSVELNMEEPGVLYNARERDGARDKSYLISTTLLEDADSNITLEYGHHAMTQLPRGGVAWIGADFREWEHPASGEVMEVQGDTVNILTPEGQTIELFNAWNWGRPEETAWFNTEYFEGAKDWTHANALSYNERTNSLLLSIRNLALLLEIDVDTGEVMRVLGGSSPEAYDPGSIPFSYQHDPNWTDEGTILMVSSAPRPDNGRTETIAREYMVLPDSNQLREVWSYGTDLGEHATYHGGARALDNGNRLINFGSAGTVHEATADGQTAWSVATTPKVAFGSTLMVDDLYDLVR